MTDPAMTDPAMTMRRQATGRPRVGRWRRAMVLLVVVAGLAVMTWWVVAPDAWIPAVLAQSGDAADPGGAISLDAYRRRLDAARRALDEGGPAAERWDQARRAEQAPAGVRLRSGDTVVPQPLLAEDGLPAAEDDGDGAGAGGSAAGGASAGHGLEDAIDAARGRLALVADQLAASGADDTSARQALLAAILTRPEFQGRRSLWERFLDWLSGLLEDRLPGAVPVWLGRLVTGFAAALGAGAILLLLAYWLRRLLAILLPEAHLATPARTGGDLPITAEEAQRQAAALAEAGNYREAVRRLYLAALLLLEERGVLRHDRSLTNREFLVQLAARPEVQGHLRPVVETFDALWYGVREPDRATFLAYQAEVGALGAAAAGGARGRGEGSARAREEVRGDAPGDGGR